MRVAIAVVVLTAGIVHAQAPRPLAFDYAYVTRSANEIEGAMLGFPSINEVGSIVNATTETIIGWAYQLQDSSRVIRSDSPGFDWDARFNIGARPRNDTSPVQQFEMLRTLLADRFKLRVHTEKRPMPVYVLTVARRGRLGPQLRRSSVDCAAPFNNLTRLRALLAGRDDSHLICYGPRDESDTDVAVLRSAGAMILLAQSLRAILDRPVLDETRLAGFFEWKLSFARTQADADANATQISTALQQQLGLKLERKTAPVEFVVVDSVEMPSEN